MLSSFSDDFPYKCENRCRRKTGLAKRHQFEEKKSNSETTGEELLKRKCAAQIKEALQRQMSKVSYLIGEIENEDILNKAPITNLGPESNFGSVDQDLKRSGNSTKLSTVSDKHIIDKNKLHINEEF